MAVKCKLKLRVVNLFAVAVLYDANIIQFEIKVHPH